MSDHFSYLYDDNESDFFQKQANAVADEALPRADEIVKTASPVSREAYSLEKMASRLEQDLFIVKTAGDSGFNMGAQSRASSYMTKFAERMDIEEDVAEVVFDRFMAGAIEHDLGIVRDELYKLADDESRPWVDSEIAAAGIDLVEAAQMEKAACVAGIAKAIRASKGLGAAARVKAVASAPRRSVREWRAGRAGAKRSKANVRLQKAQKKLETMKTRATAATVKAGKLPAGLRRDVGPGVAGRTKRRVDKATAKVQKRESQLEKAKIKHIDRKDIAQGKAPRSKQAPVETKPTTGTKQTDDITRKKTEQTAKDKSVQDDLKETTKTPKNSKNQAAESDAPGGAGGDATLGSSYKKMRDGGWGSLSGAEKQKLINAGLAGVVGHRVVMGQGAVTGGKGII